ncbi:MAG TPA: exodeoxyribonuclease V subunit gamma, partial [Caldimonas sp.]|nr:exodeoxyribonuclease V subunit gamma [Caldimonas sp.]
MDRDDESIAVHACHGPTRELEVLHDQLLALFDRAPTLDPQDVVVMTPSIDAYAPAIDAVFGCARPSIPFRIADRSARRQHEVSDAFLRALELLRGRLPAPAVLDLVALEPVRTRFDIAAEELERLRSWVADAGVRWGADGEHRAEVGQPSCTDNTWRFGLDRLLLGYALPGDSEEPFGGVLSYDDVEGSDAALLGRFAELCATLARFRAALRAPRHPTAWREVLGGLREALLATTPANAFQHQGIGAALDTLAQCAAAGGFTGAIDLDAMRALLEAELERDVSPRGFLTGAVTFCELVPMRTIPFRVVCLIGLNDDGFPRARRAPGFDRMAAHPQLGDRTARDDDRYLFLEALLAAREHLVITYVGQSISDNSERPPSVVVTELLDALDQSFVDPAGVPVRQRVVRRHPLQPFSPSYFRAAPAGDAARTLFSYDATNWAAARALLGPHAEAPGFLAAPLPAEPIDTVALDDLVRFFENPSRWFLQRRLGIFLGREAPLLEAREPIELDNLAIWRIGDSVLRHLLRGGEVAAAHTAQLASGLLPLGTHGRCTLERITPEVEELAR